MIYVYAKNDRVGFRSVLGCCFWELAAVAVKAVPLQAVLLVVQWQAHLLSSFSNYDRCQTYTRLRSLLEIRMNMANPKKVGQVVESGPYHLEFVPEKEAEGNAPRFVLTKR